MHLEVLHELRLRWRAFRMRRQLEQDLREELHFHLEMKAARLANDGTPEHEAHYAARREFGNETRWNEVLHDMWTWRWVDALASDARQAFRSLRRTPGVALAAMVVLALGFGATTAIFTVVNSAVLRPLPYQQPDRLVMLWGNVMRQKVERRGHSYPDYLDWKKQAKSFENIISATTGTFILTGVDEPERVPGEFVSAGYIEMLGIRPALGRTYTPAEDIRNGPLLAVISDSLWKRRFNADPNVVGKPVVLSQRVFTIIGVMPEGFYGVNNAAEIWAPFLASGISTDRRGNRGGAALARLKPGVTIAQAQSEMDVISKQLGQMYPATNEKRGVEVAALSTELVGPIRTPLLVLFGAVGLVLLIACANVATLLLARSESRQAEFAMRVALGASRSRLFAQQIVEGTVLAVGGAATGLVLAWLLVQLLIAASPVSLPAVLHPTLDWRVVLFAALLPVASGFLSALVPAIQSMRTKPGDTLRETARGSSRQRVRTGLVVAEVALASMLLVGAGLMLRSFEALSAIHPGYDPNGVLTMTLSLPRVDPKSPQASDPRSFINGRTILERVQQLPGVRSASLASDLPLEGSNATFYFPEGQPQTDAQNRPRAYVHYVSESYFETLRTKLVAGRWFTPPDFDRDFDGVIVSENVAKRFWPGQDPVGKRLQTGSGNPKDPWFRVIGVVGEMKLRGLPENPTADPDLYFTFSLRQRNVSLLIRTDRDPGALAQAVRSAVHEIDKSVPVYSVATLQERIRAAGERARFATWTMTVFAGFAILLTAVGLYALMAWSVRRRTREIGIRIALGADRREVLRMVLLRGLLLVLAGIVPGLAAAVAGTRFIESLLVGITPLDAATYAAVPLLLFAVGALACWVPARRAAALDPSGALRHD